MPRRNPFVDPNGGKIPPPDRVVFIEKTDHEGRVRIAERLKSLEEWREVHRNQRTHTVQIWAVVIVVAATAFGSLWVHQSDGHPTRVESRIDYHKSETRRNHDETVEAIERLEKRIRELEKEVARSSGG